MLVTLLHHECGLIASQALPVGVFPVAALHQDALELARVDDDICEGKLERPLKTYYLIIFMESRHDRNDARARSAQLSKN